MERPTCYSDIAKQNFVPCFAYGPAYQYDDECNWSENDLYLGSPLTAIENCGDILDSSICENYYLSEKTEDTGTDTYYPQCTWYDDECVKGDDLTYITEENTSKLCFIFSCNDDLPCSTESKQTCVDNKCVI